MEEIDSKSEPSDGVKVEKSEGSNLVQMTPRSSMSEISESGITEGINQATPETKKKLTRLKKYLKVSTRSKSKKKKVRVPLMEFNLAPDETEKIKEAPKAPVVEEEKKEIESKIISEMSTFSSPKPKRSSAPKPDIKPEIPEHESEMMETV